MKFVVKLLKKECPFAQGEKEYIFVSIFLVLGVNDVKSLYLRCPHFWTNERLDKHTFGQMNDWTNRYNFKNSMKTIDVIKKLIIFILKSNI